MFRAIRGSDHYCEEIFITHRGPPKTWDLLSSFVILVLQALFGNLLLSKSWVMTREHPHLQAAGLFNEGRQKKAHWSQPPTSLHNFRRPRLGDSSELFLLPPLLPQSLPGKYRNLYCTALDLKGQVSLSFGFQSSHL